MKETKMLEHQKLVLRNVAYNKEFFKKELVKTLNWINEEEKSDLYIWLKENFWSRHYDVIRELMLSPQASA